MKSSSNIDELLNGFIDEELSPRQLTEVQRLIANDIEVLRKLNELRKVKGLMESLPSEEAPQELFGEIKASLERSFLLDHSKHAGETKRGERHLLLRKILSAAAVITLVGGLFYVVFTIIDFKGAVPDNYAVESKSPESVDAGFSNKTAQPEAFAVTAEPLNAQINMQCRNFAAVDAFLKRSLSDSGLLENAEINRSQESLAIDISTSEAVMAVFLEQIKPLWPQLDAVSFTVGSNSDPKVTIDNVQINQISQIIARRTVSDSLQIARDFSLLNSSLPARTPFKNGNFSTTELAVPKPVLTSGEKNGNQKTSDSADSRNVNLKIVVELVAGQQ